MLNITAIPQSGNKDNNQKIPWKSIKFHDSSILFLIIRSDSKNKCGIDITVFGYVAYVFLHRGSYLQ
jgi:hypothetical protein